MRIGPEFASAILFIQLTSGLFGPGVSSNDTHRLPPCQACRNLASSFLHGMEKTVKGHFGGGDTAWEEAKGLIYKESELRLTEIHETICSEISIGKEQCHELAGDFEDELDMWWNDHRNAGKDLFTWLCIEEKAVCCPADHYGPECKPCPGFPNVCSGHGKCKGTGTRKGNGGCNCDIGYGGKTCESCAKGYYEAYNEGGKLICSACHKACANGCTGAGTKQCIGCKAGWEKDDDLGCIDVNECLTTETQVCRGNEFCVNSEGSYSCLQCDKSCDGCFGDGPDMCEKCAENYILKDNVCIDGSTIGRSVQMDMTRYLTYLGLCVATCIIFQKNVTIAAMVGVAVTAYISVSEYLLSTSTGL